jgi:hypothetical protein
MGRLTRSGEKINRLWEWRRREQQMASGECVASSDWRVGKQRKSRRSPQGSIRHLLSAIRGFDGFAVAVMGGDFGGLGEQRRIA